MPRVRVALPRAARVRPALPERCVGKLARTSSERLLGVASSHVPPCGDHRMARPSDRQNSRRRHRRGAANAGSPQLQRRPMEEGLSQAPFATPQYRCCWRSSSNTSRRTLFPGERLTALPTGTPGRTKIPSQASSPTHPSCRRVGLPRLRGQSSASWFSHTTKPCPSRRGW